MTATLARKWFPDGAFGSKPTKIVADLVSDWSARWLTASSAHIIPLAANIGSKLKDPTWLGYEGSACLGFDEAATSAIASGLLAHPVPDGAMPAPDRFVVDGLVRRALDDLLDSLMKAAGEASLDAPRLSSATPAANADWVRWSVGIGNNPRLFSLGCSQQLLAELGYQSAPPVPQPPLTSIEQGLKRQRVEIGTFLGASTISLAKVKQMTVGDVMLLNRHIDDDLALTLCGQPTSRPCKLGEDERGAILEILEPQASMGKPK